MGKKVNHFLEAPPIDNLSEFYGNRKRNRRLKIRPLVSSHRYYSTFGLHLIEFDKIKQFNLKTFLHILFKAFLCSVQCVTAGFFYIKETNSDILS